MKTKISIFFKSEIGLALLRPKPGDTECARFTILNHVQALHILVHAFFELEYLERTDPMNVVYINFRPGIARYPQVSSRTFSSFQNNTHKCSTRVFEQDNPRGMSNLWRGPIESMTYANKDYADRTLSPSEVGIKIV